MNIILNEYYTILIFFLLSFIISFLLISLGFLYNYEEIDIETAISKSKDLEKLSAYECGFDSFNDARLKFNVHYYLVGMLFIIFDLEIAFMFPWAIKLHNLDSLGFWSMVTFLFILTAGFVYEWKKGALDW